MSLIRVKNKYGLSSVIRGTVGRVNESVRFIRKGPLVPERWENSDSSGRRSETDKAKTQYLKTGQRILNKGNPISCDTREHSVYGVIFTSITHGDVYDSHRLVPEWSCEE